jgi:DNA-binding transcriptional regulator YdaS (Cro superfamily)
LLPTQQRLKSLGVEDSLQQSHLSVTTVPAARSENIIPAVRGRVSKKTVDAMAATATHVIVSLVLQSKQPKQLLVGGS